MRPLLISLPLLGQLADVVTTCIGLSMGFEEGNILMKDLLEHWPSVAIGLKVVLGVVGGAVVAVAFRDGHDTLAKVGSGLFLLGGLIPAIWNVGKILHAW